jgi:putative photosynthetic complex assembly protein
MSEFTDRPFPRGALVGASVMVGVSLLLATIVRLTGADISSAPPITPLTVRYLRFADRTDGGVAVYDANGNEPITVLSPGTNGFVRATMRNFARERRSNGIGSDAPFKLTAGTDGRLVLADTATGRTIDLEAFGPSNAGVFAGFLESHAPGDPHHD